MVDHYEDEHGKIINRKQASQVVYRRILPLNTAAGILKPREVRARATTSDRTNINFAQQYRRHSLIDNCFNSMREKNVGRCNKSQRTFGEVMHHFVVGLDEMCLMSDAHGNLRIIGAAEKKKHEKLLQDLRVSITVVHTGTTGGTTGPTIFLMKGESIVCICELYSQLKNVILIMFLKARSAVNVTQMNGISGMDAHLVQPSL